MIVIHDKTINELFYSFKIFKICFQLKQNDRPADILQTFDSELMTLPASTSLIQSENDLSENYPSSWLKEIKMKYRKRKNLDAPSSTPLVTSVVIIKK